jgi:type I restriction enzyme M protein
MTSNGYYIDYKKLLQAHAVDVMITIGTNFFYTVTLPCILWFLDLGKAKTDRKDKVANLKEIEAQGWTLNPGRYVGVADKAEDDFDFAERLGQLNEELEVLNSEARELEERIAGNVAKLLEVVT